MEIEKNGFYDLSLIEDIEIVIAKGVVADIFDEGKRDRKIILGEKSTLNYFAFLGKTGKKSLIFNQEESDSSLIINNLLYSKKDKVIDFKLKTKVKSDNCKTNVKILSIVENGGKIKLDGVIKICKKLKNIEARLDEENIYIGETGKVKASPQLLIESDDVKASHSCKIEKIGGEKLFYIQTRGLSKKEAQKFILDAKIKSLFEGLSFDNFDEIYKKVLYI